MVLQGGPILDTLHRKTRQNHVENDEEFNSFVKTKLERNMNDFNIELFVRAKLLPKFLVECPTVRVKDLYVIFDNASQTI
jgi:hypothetical protein